MKEGRPPAHRVKDGGLTEETTMGADRVQPLPEPGEECGGFTALQRGRIPRLGAETVLFHHETSGAELLFVHNDDEELGFSIIYRTPSLDETDANHVLEHGVVTASRKYSGRDVFFDAANKSYNTFVNACTYPVMTCYPVCSQSEKQLVRLIDVYLSCMTDPELLREPNIFRREGVRYELWGRDQAIRLAGTVYGEDFGYLTDTGDEARRNMLRLLYPGLNAANCVGRAHRNYRDLTWEGVKSVYERFYTFDNALMILYGNCRDYRETLRFLDQEYLAAGCRAGTGSAAALDSSAAARDSSVGVLDSAAAARDSSVGVLDSPAAAPDRSVAVHIPLAGGSSIGAVHDWFKEPTAQGHAEETFLSPAYEGDASDHTSIVEFGIDVSDLTWQELFRLDLITDMLDHENSAFHRKLKAEGVRSRAYCDLSGDCAKAYFTMGIEDAGEEQKDALRRAVERTLEEAASRGIDPKIAEVVIKDRELSSLLTREGTALGAEIASAVGLYWALTGETDYYTQRDQAFFDVKNDVDQKVLRALMQKLRGAKRTALAVTVPAPGLAEQLEAELEQELAERKKSMKAEELDALIRQTDEFDRWNKREESSGGFAISSGELPPPSAPVEFSRNQLGGLVSYTAAAEGGRAGGAVCCKVMFDTGTVKEEDLHFLTLYTMLLLELDTERFSVEEQKLMEIRYLSQLSLDFAYPDERALDGMGPMLTARWYGLTEDFDASLDFLLEILGRTKFEDAGEILRLIEKYKYDYDLSRCGDGLEIALDLAGGFVDFYQRYRNYMEGQGFYRFLCEMAERMKENPAFGEEVKAGLARAVDGVLHGEKVYALTAASAEELPKLEEILKDRLSGTVAKGAVRSEAWNRPKGYACLEKQLMKRTGICIEASDQCSVRLVGFGENPKFRGRYLPFFMAAADRCLVPKLRFEGGAYGAGAAFRLTLGQLYIYSSGDPNVGSTLDCFDQVWERLREMEIAEDELDGYILGAYAAAERPEGPLGRAMHGLDCAVEGVRLQKIREITEDIRRASPADQQAAADFFAELFREGCTITLGNGMRLAEEAERFGELIDYKM